MTAKTYARIENGAVAEIVTLDAKLAIADCFHPELVFVDVTDVSPTPEVGNTYSAPLTFGPTPARVIPKHKRAFAALAAGLTITSKGTPAVSGIYACDNGQRNFIARLRAHIAKHDGFPGGLSFMQLRATDGSAIQIPSLALFDEVASAVENYVAKVEEAELVMIGGGEWQAPKNSATIA